MASDDWSAFEDRLERRLKSADRKKRAYQQSGKSVFMLKQLMNRPGKATAKPRKRRK